MCRYVSFLMEEREQRGTNRCRVCGEFSYVKLLNQGLWADCHANVNTRYLHDMNRHILELNDRHGDKIFSS